VHDHPCAVPRRPHLFWVELIHTNFDVPEAQRRRGSPRPRDANDATSLLGRGWDVPVSTGSGAITSGCMDLCLVRAKARSDASSSTVVLCSFMNHERQTSRHLLSSLDAWKAIVTADALKSTVTSIVSLCTSVSSSACCHFILPGPFVILPLSHPPLQHSLTSLWSGICREQVRSESNRRRGCYTIQAHGPYQRRDSPAADRDAPIPSVLDSSRRLHGITRSRGTLKGRRDPVYEMAPGSPTRLTS
jgi:hypothetical protein